MATENSRLSAGQILFAIIYTLIGPILVLLLSADWLWVEGWIFSVWLIIISVATVIYLYRKDPVYLGAIFLFIGTPMLLGSKYGVFLGVVVSFLLIARIFG